MGNGAGDPPSDPTTRTVVSHHLATHDCMSAPPPHPPTQTGPGQSVCSFTQPPPPVSLSLTNAVVACCHPPPPPHTHTSAIFVSPSLDNLLSSLSKSIDVRVVCVCMKKRVPLPGPTPQCTCVIQTMCVIQLPMFVYQCDSNRFSTVCMGVIPTMCMCVIQTARSGATA